MLEVVNVGHCSSFMACVKTKLKKPHWQRLLMLFGKEDAVDLKVIRSAGKKEGLKSYQNLQTEYMPPINHGDIELYVSDAHV